MADVCEICMKQIEFTEIHGSLIDYDSVEFILCDECQEEIDFICENSRKSLKTCVEEVRKRKNEKLRGKMSLQTNFEGRILKQISYEQVKENNLKEVGRCFAANLGHALFLMSKYCKEKDLTKYYLIELKIENTNNKIILPTNQSSMMIFKFYKD